MSFYLKDPHSRVDYAIDWGSYLAPGQTIVDSAWIVDPGESGGIAVDGDSFTASGAAATLTGGVAGHVYRVCNRVTLSDGRSDERSLTLRAEQR